MPRCVAPRRVRRTGSSLFRHRIIDSHSFSFCSRKGRASHSFSLSLFLSFSLSSSVPSPLPSFFSYLFLFIAFSFSPEYRGRRPVLRWTPRYRFQNGSCLAVHMGPELSKPRGTRRFPVSVFALAFPVSPAPVTPRSTAVEKSISIVRARSERLPAHNRRREGRTTSAVLNI